MGLFGGYKCSFCGADRGFLGNTSLKDGNLCGDCEGKLSPFFKVKEQMTVSEVGAQLKYREENQKNLESFAEDEQITLAEDTIYLDKKAGRLFISKTAKGKAGNPDLFPFSGIQQVSCRVDRNRETLQWKNAAGEIISCEPPIYKTTYALSLCLTVANDHVTGQYTLKFASDLDGMDAFQLITRKEELDEIIAGLKALRG